MKKILAVLTLTVASALPAQAQSNDRLGLSLVAWVHAIDASPDWRAQLDGLSLNEGTRSARIGTLKVAAESGGMNIELTDIILDGYAEPAEGGFTATSLKVGSATVKNAETDILLSNAEFREIVVPSLAGISFQRRQPFTSLLPALGAIVQSKSTEGSIGEIAIIERFENVESRISYRNIDYRNVAGGKIDSVRAGPLNVESPSPNPLVATTVARAEVRGIDLDAFLAVYDPARYDGSGNRQWRTAVANADYSDLAINGPGMSLLIGGAAIQNFSVRQPPEPFAALADASLADTDLAPEMMAALQARYLADLLGAYGIGKFSLNDISFTASGIDEFSLKRILMAEASSDRIGEIALEGLVAAIAGQGGVGIKRLAFGNIVPPATERLLAATEQWSRGADVDVSALSPQLGFLQADGVNFQAVDFPGAALGKLRLDASDYVGAIPGTTSVRIEGLDIPVAELLPPRAGGIINGLGYKRLDADLSLDLAWDEAESAFKLDGFALDITDFGKTTADVALTGLTRDLLETADTAAILGALKLDSASLTFEDKSLVDRSLAMRADLLNVPVDRLKQQLAGALPLMLAVLGNSETIQKIVPVLQTFIKTPGTLTVEARPSEPVAVSDIEKAIRTRPQSLPGLLSITLSGTAGTGTAPKADEPAAPTEAPMRKTLAPPGRPDTTGATEKPIPAEQP